MNISKADAIDNSEIIETINETNRKLASIQVIQELRPIAGADKIVVATMEDLGWECVVKKGEFNIGDKIVYIEVDSICPQKPEFEFLRERKFRVKTIKLRKQISSGLIVPLSVLPDNANCYAPKKGDDVTALIGITKHDPEGKAEQALIEKERRSPLMRFAMGIPAFRWVYLKLNEKNKGNFPQWMKKSDETRIQVCAKYMMEHYNEEWEITEKLDGQSHSAFVHPMKVWGFNKKVFGVCSRSIWLKTPNSSKYWETARKYNLEAALSKEGKDVYIQSEQCGPGIQANKYKLTETELYVFNLVVGGRKLSYPYILGFCKDNGLKPVPLVHGSFIPKVEIGENKSVMEVVGFMVALSQGHSALLDRPREGIVCRLKSNPEISLKVINPLFKMEQEAEEDKDE